MKKLVIESLNEIYSDEDFVKGDALKDNSFGITIDFPGDFKRRRLLIKKIVRAKYQISDDEIKKLLDEVINELEK